MRIDLGDEDWAEVRPAKKIPHGLTMEYREVFFEMVNVSLAADANGEAELPTASTVMARGGLMVDQRLTNAFVLAIVKEWSFGPVDLKTLFEVPTADLKAITDAVDAEEYAKVLTPDFDNKVDREPGSPTSPSAP